MKKQLTAIILTISLLLALSNFIFAEDTTYSPEAKEVTKEEVMKETPSITPREATISMLLDSGWTRAEIDEWLTEEMLLEYDQNAKAISNNSTYTVNRENSETGEIVSEQLSRQEFDYGVNANRCREEDHDNTKLSTLSANGVLELQPVFGVGSVDHITTNDKIEYLYYPDNNGVSGASIWNADSECFLKQSMALVWMGNGNYVTQYRFEWMTEPYYKLTDSFAVALATDLIIHDNPRQYFVLKYTAVDIDSQEEVTSLLPDGVWCDIDMLTSTPGFQVTIDWPELPYPRDQLLAPVYPVTQLKGFLQFYAHVNNRYDYDQFFAHAQYFHGILALNVDPTITVDITGVAASFSINWSLKFVKESHEMDVRANNPYLN